MKHADPLWRKSSHSGEDSSSTCVEVAVVEALIGFTCWWSTRRRLRWRRW
ncbi:DUF397 domain-containing protein [Actinomadura sp. NBRC 104425]